MRESWVPVAGYGARYEVSDTGYIRDRFTGTDAPERTTRSGVRFVRLKHEDQSRAWVPVSRIVYNTFYGDMPRGHYIDFIDGNRANCGKYNLTTSETKLPRAKPAPNVKCRNHRHPLVSWNVTKGNRCRACKSASKSGRTPDEEFARLYEKHYGVPYVDDRAEYFDRSGIGVWDIYSGL